MNKKILSVLLVFMMCVSLSACGEGNLDNDINNGGNTESVSVGSSEYTEEAAADTTSQTVTAEEAETVPHDVTSVDSDNSASIESSASEASRAEETQPPQTAAVVPEVTEPPALQWREAAASGTMYVNTNGVYSRISAIQGSERISAYGLNQAVNVIAKTDTGYYKIKDGEYIHGDFLSTSEVTSAASSETKPAVTTASEAAPKPPAVTTVREDNPSDSGRRKQTQSEIDFANEVFDLINAERAKKNLPSFKKLDALTEISAVRTWELSVSFGHGRPDGSKTSQLFYDSGLNYSFIGENIAAGQTTPKEVVEAWMNSETHRNNILSEDYVYMGVGYYNIPGSEYINYWTQNFYTPL